MVKGIFNNGRLELVLDNSNWVINGAWQATINEADKTYTCNANGRVFVYDYLRIFPTVPMSFVYKDVLDNIRTILESEKDMSHITTLEQL